MKKIMYGLLISKYYDDSIGRRVYEREMTYSDCCCAEEGYVLYDTKKQAKALNIPVEQLKIKK